MILAPRRWLACLLATAWIVVFGLEMGFAQEQIDKLERQKQAAAAIAEMTLRVRVIKCVPESKELLIHWRRGGEGLGGTVVRSSFVPEGLAQPNIDAKPGASSSSFLTLNQWTAWTPVESVCGRAKSFEFPSVTVAYPPQGKRQLDPPQEIVVEFEFAERGKTFHAFTEPAPRGATVGFAFPALLLDQRGARNAEFVKSLQGLSGHVRARRERLEQLFPEPAAPPKLFGVIGHLAGYGQGPGSGLGKAVGFGVRHCNPAIVADECRTFQLLGINGLVDEKSLKMVELAGQSEHFRRVYWGGPGSGSPMAAVSSTTVGEPDGCPFDPKLKTTMAEQVARAIAQHEQSHAASRWGLWWDEIGVAAKGHINNCPRCRDQFREYLQRQGLTPPDVGATRWDEVAPYPLWTVVKSKTGAKQTLAAPPEGAAQRLRYYYTYRFMTFATGNLFPDSAQQLKQAGIWLYAMQGPTPSWNGSSLDWHEFYDVGANTALVFETSNRDARTWQWESYLADIMRGISQRHGGMPMGCLVKPHRGAPQQRMLSVVARGTESLEWYTYGPDYAKGDSFSQAPDLLEEVAHAGRFLAQAEPHLWQAKFGAEPTVGFVFPRSSEIWGRVGALGMTALENAKWVYLALRHEHVPVEILSEQQLAEGVPSRLKVLYVTGPNLRQDATRNVAAWIESGGTLWTDAIGLSRDERDEPNVTGNQLLQVGNRQLQSWGKTPEYRATTLEPLSESTIPAYADVNWTSESAWGNGSIRAAVAREALSAAEPHVIARFADRQPAVVERSVGKGRVVAVGLWSGLTYSARVRRPDFDMQTDFDPAIRRLITTTALQYAGERPVVTANAQVEAVYLKNATGACVALTNWSYIADREAPRGERLQSAKELTIKLPSDCVATSVRSLRLNQTLPVNNRSVVLPSIDAIDVLVWK